MVPMSTKSRQVIYGSRIAGAKIRAEEARKRAVEAAREADRADAEAMVHPHGRLWRTGAAVPNHRPMPQRRLWLARGSMPSVRDPRQPAARRHPSAARYPDLEIGGGAEMPVVSDAALFATGAHDQVD
jgi:hypothetical protein